MPVLENNTMPMPLGHWRSLQNQCRSVNANSAAANRPRWAMEGDAVRPLDVFAKPKVFAVPGSSVLG